MSGEPRQRKLGSTDADGNWQLGSPTAANGEKTQTVTGYKRRAPTAATDGCHRRATQCWQFAGGDSAQRRQGKGGGQDPCPSHHTTLFERRCAPSSSAMTANGRALEHYWQIYWASYWNSPSKRFTGRFTAHITGKKDYCPVTGVPVTTKHVTGAAVTTKREHQSIVSLASSSAEHQNAGSFGRCSHTPLASAQHREG